MLSKSFGKYKVLVTAIALFLIFDLGVLVLNFYTSGQIAEQTERINLAGRQRTLTQQMSKATLYIKAQKLNNWPYESGLIELKNHYGIFDSTLHSLNHGGESVSTRTGEPFIISPVNGDKGLTLLGEANALWEDFESALAPVMVDLLVTDEEIKPASSFIAQNNLKMYDVMNRLTNHFKEQSDKQTSFLRIAQIVGISLATINFFIILFHFLRQLRNRDEKIELAKQESDQILSTIDEGVLLVDKDMIIGGQHSRHLEKLFATKKIANRNLQKFLRRYLPRETVETAVEYINLFFAKHVSSDLVKDINPLQRIKANVENSHGNLEEKFLDFSFAKIRQNDEHEMVLVTIKDVTAEVQLEEQRELADNRSQQQLVLLAEIIMVDSQDFDLFMKSYQAGLLKINTLLRKDSMRKHRYQNIISNVFMESHQLKGEAGALDLSTISEELQLFEDELAHLRQKRSLHGRDFLTITMRLKQMIEGLEEITSMRERLRNHNSEKSVASISRLPNQALPKQVNDGVFRPWRSLNEYAQKTAIEVSKDTPSQAKKVQLSLRGFDVEMHEDSASKLHGVAIQLIQNSIAHGIESTQERINSCKPEAGQINLTLSGNGRGVYRFIYEDDGSGFDFQEIRNTLVDKKLVDHNTAAKLSNQQLIRSSFRDGLTTAKEASKVAGLGVGLASLKHQVAALKGRLLIRSTPNELTQFIIDFSDSALYNSTMSQN